MDNHQCLKKKVCVCVLDRCKDLVFCAFAARTCYSVSRWKHEQMLRNLKCKKPPPVFPKRDTKKTKETNKKCQKALNNFQITSESQRKNKQFQKRNQQQPNKANKTENSPKKKNKTEVLAPHSPELRSSKLASSKVGPSKAASSVKRKTTESPWCKTKKTKKKKKTVNHKISFFERS